MGRAADPIIARAAAVAIVRRLREAGHTAYFAGGCVRDELLGLRPTDYDVATDATPNRVRELFPRALEVGAAFGVMIVRMDGAEVEVATFRAEGPYSDTRRPDTVHFSDPRTDALRRDFTINALFLDPIGAADAPTIHGHVIDYVGGMEDLRRGIVRAVGDPDQRLAEDHLRALRAVRFAARLGFTVDPATESAVRRHARELRGVSRERIGDEFRRMMAHPSRATAAERLQVLGLDTPVLNEPPPSVPPPLLPTLTGIGLADEPISYATCLASWALDRHGLSIAADRAFVQRWRAALNLNNDETAALSDVLGGYSLLVGGTEPPDFTNWTSASVARQKRLVAKSWFADALRILGVRYPDAAIGIAARAAELARSPGGIAPVPLLTGDHLVAMGLHPGPRFKTILDAVYDAQLEGRIATLEEARELARTLSV